MNIPHMKFLQTKGHTRIMIRKADREDAKVLAELAIQMWENHTVDELTDEFHDIIGNEDAACFLKYVDGRPVAFVQ